MAATEGEGERAGLAPLDPSCSPWTGGGGRRFAGCQPPREPAHRSRLGAVVRRKGVSAAAEGEVKRRPSASIRFREHEPGDHDDNHYHHDRSVTRDEHAVYHSSCAARHYSSGVSFRRLGRASLRRRRLRIPFNPRLQVAELAGLHHPMRRLPSG
jgi:hypothetical protein